MSFYGKVYNFAKEENFVAFLDKLALTGNIRERLATYKPSLQLVDNGDGTFTFNSVFDGRTKSLTFKSGVEFTESLGDNKIQAKTTFTLSGNTLSQVQKLDDGRVFTYEREFTDTDLKEAISFDGWDGAGYKYYKA